MLSTKDTSLLYNSLLDSTIMYNKIAILLYRLTTSIIKYNISHGLSNDN